MFVCIRDSYIHFPLFQSHSLVNLVSLGVLLLLLSLGLKSSCNFFFFFLYAGEGQLGRAMGGLGGMRMPPLLTLGNRILSISLNEMDIINFT